MQPVDAQQTMRRFATASLTLLIVGALAAGAAAPSRAQDRPDRVPRPAAGIGGATLESEHFHIVYNPARVTPAQAEEARSVAEGAWTKCSRLFKGEPGRSIRLDLTPDFTGATGFAIPVREWLGAKGSGLLPWAQQVHSAFAGSQTATA